MKRLLIVCVFFCIAFTTNSQTIQDSIAIQQIANDVLTKGEAYNNLYYLCKKIGPRLSGSPQAQKAVEAGISMLKKAGADTVYLQPCMVPHWVRGKKETGFIAYNNGVQYPLQLCALGNSVGTGNKGVSAPIIEVHSFDELQQLGKIVKGKIVFFNVEMNPTHIHTFKAYGESGFARRSGAAIAAKYGAVAVMVRSLASNDDDFPHTGVMSYNDSFPKIPAVAISTNNANWLSKQLLSKKTVTAFLQTNCSMQKEVLSYNVVGEIKGSEKADEIITVGGHLDSWDLAEGAHDDGAGIVQSIEVIRVFKAQGIQPKRTLRAVLFMNEENGGKGAEKYLAVAKEKNEQHLFALESDAGGFTPRGFSFDMPENKLTAIKQWKNLFYPYGVYDFSAGGSGADIGPLKTIGAALAGLRPDSQRYFDVHHASIDVFETVSKRELHLGAINMAALIFLVDKYGL
jgi:carboxypeptidase Q